MTKISIIKIVESTSVDGPGFRTSIYSAGCSHRCPGCHNPQSWDINSGTMMDVEDILAEIVKEDFSNVTFTGGDPMYQASAFAELAKRIKQTTDKNIWCYTGYTFEEAILDKAMLELLNNIDVLVDGRYVAAQNDLSLVFKGSRNQRLIDVKASLAIGEAVEYKYNPFPDFDNVEVNALESLLSHY